VGFSIRSLVIRLLISFDRLQWPQSNGSSASRMALSGVMTARRFPPPWSVEEQDACFVVISAGQKLA